MDVHRSRQYNSYTKAMAMEPNKVFVNNQGIIEIHVVGDQTPESVRMMGAEAMHLAECQRQAGKPVVLLDNILQMGQVPPEGRKVVVEYGKKINYDRLAMVGKGAVLKIGANLLLQAVGKSGKVRYFEDEATAKRWLLSDLNRS